MNITEANRIVEAAVELLLSLNGTTETDAAGTYTPNRGVVIDHIQRQFGMKGEEYCAMTAQYPYLVIRQEQGLSYQLPMTASSQTLWEWASKRGLAFTDPQLLQRGDWMVWRKFKLWKGHVATFVEFQPLIHDLANPKWIETRKVATIEGNIQGGRRVQGIWTFERSVDKLSFAYDDFYLRGFVDVRKMLLAA